MALTAGAARADEVTVSTSAMQDIEFDHDHAMFEWVDVNHRLWAGAVDTTTGALIPSSGMGTLIDKYCTTSSTFGNGPEYVQSSTGYSIVYNKYIPSTTQDNSKDPTKTYVAKATLSGSTWTTNGAAWQGTTLGFV